MYQITDIKRVNTEIDKNKRVFFALSILLKLKTSDKSINITPTMIKSNHGGENIKLAASPKINSRHHTKK